MNKKLGRFLHSHVWIYFVMMLGFAVASFVLRQYILAGVELLLTVAAVLIYVTHKRNRHWEVQQFLNKMTDSQTGAKGAESPFPTVVIRLPSGQVLLGNESFCTATGYHGSMTERMIGDIIPELPTDWLGAGKTEYPYDITVQQRRYRVFGTMVRGDDPKQTPMGVLRFVDLTELYQVRDEYIRSRPVVSIIMVDNYEELTKNMSDGATSALHAKINDAITKWTDRYHGLLRRLEKNRFLFIFEKRDLKVAEEDKFSILEDIHQITNPSGLAASLSIGVGVDGVDYEECYSFAALSIEMALSRGGDQAVIKDRR